MKFAHWLCLLFVPLLWIGACQSSPTSSSSNGDEKKSQTSREGKQGEFPTDNTSEPSSREVLEKNNDAGQEKGRELGQEPQTEPGTEPTSDTTQDAGISDAGEPVAEKTTAPEPSPDKVQPPASRCKNRKKQSQDKLWFVSVGLSVRRFFVHIPKNYDPNKAYPLIFNIHGHTSADWQQAVLTDLNKKADKEGFVVIHPQAVTVPKSWNAGGCCPPANTLGIKDLEFFKKMLQKVHTEYCIDKKRVFSTGMSNGGMMSYRLACDMSDKIAAIAPVAGAMVPKNCKPTRPLSVIVFHGTKDSIVPYNGSKLLGFPSTKDSVSFWVKHNKCPSKSRQTYKKGDVTCEEWGPCDKSTRVVLCTVDGGGHTWPGGFPLPTGKTTRNINATDEIWKFFKPIRLP